MFEIGSTLRDARVRMDISLQQAEEDTKIRVKYIQAMENEDFEILPAGTYVKGFLRTYAEYLDLDYQLLLDEFNERFGTGEHREHLIQPPKTAKAEAPRKHPANYMIVAILAVVIIAVLAYLGWGNKDVERPPVSSTNGDSTTQTTAAAAPVTVATVATQTRPNTLETITIEAAGDDAWVELRKASDKSAIIAETLYASPSGDQKKNVSLTRAVDFPSETRLLLSVGSTGLVITVNGQPQTLLDKAPADYQVTASGISPDQ